MNRSEKLNDIIAELSKEGLKKQSAHDWLIYIYYPVTGQIMKEQTTHSRLLFQKYNEMEFLSDEEKEEVSRAETPESEEMENAFKTILNECLTCNKLGTSISFGLPHKNRYWFNIIQNFISNEKINGNIEAIRFNDNSSGIINISTYDLLSAMNWRELDMNKYLADDKIIQSSRINEIVALAKKTSYKEKRKEESGNITYVYDKKHIEERTKKKSNQVEKLRKSIPKLRTQVKKDLSSDDDKLKYTALAVALIDETYERVGNKESAEENEHYGVTRWLIKHITFSGNKAKIKYVGKSGVNQEKEVTNSKVLSVLKEACKGKKKEDRVFEWDDFMINRKRVNAYLSDFDITTKDIRGFHANDEMLTQLKKVRKGALPKDKGDKEKKLKEEFKEALEETAKIVGHEASTLKSQYLVPNLESTFLESGKILSSLNNLFRQYDIEKYAEEVLPVENFKIKTLSNLDINDRLIRLGNKLEESGFNKYAEKIDGLIDCLFGGERCGS